MRTKLVWSVLVSCAVSGFAALAEENAGGCCGAAAAPAAPACAVAAPAAAADQPACAQANAPCCPKDKAACAQRRAQCAQAQPGCCPKAQAACKAKKTCCAAGQPQTRCPVMGGAIDKAHYADYQGQRVYFCCGGCIAKFQADPAKYVAQLKQAGVKLEAAPAATP